MEFVLFDHKIRNKIKMFDKIRNINGIYTTFIIVQTFVTDTYQVKDRHDGLK